MISGINPPPFSFEVCLRTCGDGTIIIGSGEQLVLDGYEPPYFWESGHELALNELRNLLEGRIVMVIRLGPPKSGLTRAKVFRHGIDVSERLQPLGR